MERYLNDEGWLQNTGDALGLCRQVVSLIIWQVLKAITIFMGPDYVKTPHTNPEMRDLGVNLHQTLGLPERLGATYVPWSIRGRCFYKLFGVKSIWNESSVYNLCIKSSRFSVGSGLPQRYALLPLLLVCFVMDRMQPVQVRPRESAALWH